MSPTPLCPVCTANSNPFLQIGEHTIALCTHCGHRFCATPPVAAHLEREYGDDYFCGGGSGYPDYLATGGLISTHANRYASLLDPHLASGVRGSLLDVGCAAGFVMRGFASAGWQVAGVDPNQKMVEHARRVLGLNASCGTLETIASIPDLSIPPGGFDLVVMIQVIAHLQDLTASTRALTRLLRPGGLVLVETWNSDSLMARTLSHRWHEYNPPNVLHNFTLRSTDTLMERAGLQRVAYGRPPKRISASHLRSALRHKYGDSGLGGALQRAVRLVPDRVALPYPSEDLFWRLYRAQ